jgi:hypothetical protein
MKKNDTGYQIARMLARICRIDLASSRCKQAINYDFYDFKASLNHRENACSCYFNVHSKNTHKYLRTARYLRP